MALFFQRFRMKILLNGFNKMNGHSQKIGSELRSWYFIYELCLNI